MSSDKQSFSDLGLSEPILRVLNEIGYESPSPIQAECIPLLLGDQDMLGQAQTGTGKTAAFALPFLSKMDLHQKTPRLLVLTPTRELAIQVAEAFQVYARFLSSFHVLPVYGGQNITTQLSRLKRGTHVVVGTPGRVMDHLRRGSLKLDSLQYLVLDEADEMLKMGFIDDVEWILEHTPATRQTALFSATMPDAVRRVARKHLRDPREIKIKTGSITVATIDQQYLDVSGLHKLDILTRILEVEDFDAVLIFVRTKLGTVELAEKLQARGFESGALNGDMKQADRERTIVQLKNKKLDIVTATDVAARGLDVERISHVINYDIPYDVETYVHRIGRTGRAGRSGKAILFVAPREKRMLRSIEKAVKKPIERMRLPSREAVTDRRVEKFQQTLLDVIETEDLSFCREVITRTSEEKNVSKLEIAAALTFLNQKKRPLRLLDDTEKNRKARRTRDAEDGRSPGRSTKRAEPASHRVDRASQHDDSDRKDRKRDALPLQRHEKKRHENLKDLDMLRYRIEAGLDHGVLASDIVGAIANEAGIESSYIGDINIQGEFSTVELPEGMPREIFQHLKKTRLRGQPMNIHLEKESSEDGTPSRSSVTRKKSATRKKSVTKSNRPQGKGQKQTGFKPSFKSGKKKLGSRRKPAK